MYKFGLYSRFTRCQLAWRAVSKSCGLRAALSRFIDPGVPKPPGWRFCPRVVPAPCCANESSLAARLARVEAVLFLAKEPLSSRKLANLANLADGSEARILVRQLQERYSQRRRAFQVEELAGGFQLLTRPEYSRYLKSLPVENPAARLSTPALETLTIVAYRQPVLRAEVEAIRGVACDEILRQLMDRDLLRIVGRSTELGRPILYGTTRRFLEVFGLKSLDDLPRARQFAHFGAALTKELPGDASKEAGAYST